MNDYIQKYGQNAIQAYKKQLRMSESIEKYSPRKQQSHLLPKQSMSKKSLKSASRNASKTKLNHSKSIKNPKFQQNNLYEQRKKGGSFVQSKKNFGVSYLIPQNSNGFSHTFNKNSSHLNPTVNVNNKKKLVINSAQTPTSTPMRLNLNKHNEKVKDNRDIHQRDKQTQRMHRNSSGNKDHLLTSTDYKKRVIVQNKLQQTLTQKKTIKSLVKGIVQCFQIILNQDEKMKKMFYLVKQIVQKISNLAQSYKNKLKRANQKIKLYKDIQNVYISNDNNYLKTKLKLQKSGFSDNSDIVNKTNIKKKQTIQMIILNQNYDLRKKIQKLQKELDYYSNQQASLMNVFGKYKNTDSQLRIIDSFKNYEQTHMRSSSHQNIKNLSNRRSSQNLLYNQQENQTIGIQKRLSFDPYQTNDIKYKYSSNAPPIKKINNNFQNKNTPMQQLSEQEDQEQNTHNN